MRAGGCIRCDLRFGHVSLVPVASRGAQHVRQGQRFFDVVWTVSLWLDTITMLPQLWMLTKLGGQVNFGVLCGFWVLLRLCRCDCCGCLQFVLFRDAAVVRGNRRGAESRGSVLRVTAGCRSACWRMLRG